MYNFFFQHFLRNPKKVGAIVPLSKSVAKQLIRHLDMRTDNTPWKILEVGAGTGNITKSLLASMQNQDTLDLVEIDKSCCDFLKNKLSENPRVTVNCLSILDWSPAYKYDFIVSTLPLNSFPPEFVSKIFAHYLKLGNEHSVCTYVEYIGIDKLNFLFANKDKKKLIKKRRKVLGQFLKNHLLEKSTVFANFSPCHVYHLKLHPSLLNR